MTKRGHPVGQDQTQAIALAACEYAWLAQAIVERSRSTVLADVIAGGEALGTSYRSPSTFGTKRGRGCTTVCSCSATSSTTKRAPV